MRELRCTGGETRSGRGLGPVDQAAHAVTAEKHVGPVADKPKLLDFRPKEAHGFNNN
jgi:hypothetical protein